jgi:hypothetical protein
MTKYITQYITLYITLYITITHAQYCTNHASSA